MIKKKKRKKLPSIKRLRKQLDTTFNAYIRLRDGKCILTEEKNDLSCSHYYDKKNNPYLRWDERNAHAMTKKTHWRHHHGKAPDYALWMFEHNTMVFMVKLAKDAEKEYKPKRAELIKLIGYYQNKTNEVRRGL